MTARRRFLLGAAAAALGPAGVFAQERVRQLTVVVDNRAGAAGIKLEHVPFKGGAPAIQDLLGGPFPS